MFSKKAEPDIVGSAFTTIYPPKTQVLGELAGDSAKVYVDARNVK
jgi:hypothetical protein